MVIVDNNVKKHIAGKTTISKILLHYVPFWNIIIPKIVLIRQEGENKTAVRKIFEKIFKKLQPFIQKDTLYK